MYRVSEGVRCTHGQDGAIVLNVQQGQIFNLNLVGSRILELLEAGCDEPWIVNLISQEFRKEPGVVAHDVREFIESLKRLQLLLDV
jgi:Coenzyme PQQ synthesis protein D (PqqD)